MQNKLPESVRFTDERQVSFTSYGTKLQNEISMLIDLFHETKDIRITAALVTKVEQLSVHPDYKEIRQVLIDKYKSYYNIDYSYLL